MITYFQLFFLDLNSNKMRSNLILIFSLFLFAVKSNAQYHFNENSCIDNQPDSESNLERQDTDTPFEIKLSSSEFNVNSEQSLIVSIQSNLNDLTVSGFMLQAVLDDSKLNKVVGKWDLTNIKNENIKTIDCNGPKDTLVEFGSESSNKFEWRFTGEFDTEITSSIRFM